MNGYYPAMLNIAGRRCVVIGGGAVAARKTDGLLEAGADVLVISPSLTARLRALCADGLIRAEERAYRAGDLAGAALAFAAASDPAVNRAVADEAAARGIPVNAADRAERGTFVTPAVLRRGELLIAVTASGASPALAARVARELGERYGEEWAGYTAWLRMLRERAQAVLPDPAERRAVLRAAAELPPSSPGAGSREDELDKTLSTLRKQLKRGDDKHEAGAEAADDNGRDKAERAGADTDGSGH